MLANAVRIVLAQPKNLSASSAVAATCTFIGDLLEPMANFTLYFLIGFAAILAGSLMRLSYLQRVLQLSGNTLDPERDPRLEGVRLLLPLSFIGIVFAGGL